MARSLKKGPFADASLLKKVDAMNAAGSKQVIKTYLHTTLNKTISLLFCKFDCKSTKKTGYRTMFYANYS